MDYKGNKVVQLIDGGTMYDIKIDFDSGVVIRLQDKKMAPIMHLQDNVIYTDEKRKSAIVFDEKFALSGDIDEGNLVYAQPMSIWHMPKNKALFFEVAKNACTSVLSRIYETNWQRWWSPRISAKNLIWPITLKYKGYYKHKMLITKTEYYQRVDEFAEYTKFLIYDDPLKRFLRMANNKYISLDVIASNIQPPYGKNPNDYIDKLLLAIKLDTLNSYFWDQHIVPITLSGKDYLEDLTDICYLKDLDSFMLEKFGMTLKRYNVMPSEKKIFTVESLLPRQIERIKELYKEDYELPQKYKEKFYKPSNKG